MQLHERVHKALDDADIGHFEAAMMHAFAAVDRSAKKMFPQQTQGPRFIRFIRHHIETIEYMMAQGIDLENTRFENVVNKKGVAPDFAEIVYEIHRCSQMHGDDVPPEFEILPTTGQYGSDWELKKGSVKIPDRILYALLGSVVFSPVNMDIKSSGPHWLSWGRYRFVIKDWWGREQDLQPVFATEPRIRVKLDGLGGMVAEP